MTEQKFYAAVVRHEAWDAPKVFLGLTQAEATKKANDFVEQEMTDAWDETNDGKLDDWIQDCWDQGNWEFDEAEEVVL